MPNSTFAEPKFPFTHAAVASRVAVVDAVLAKSKTSALLPAGDAALATLSQATADVAQSESVIAALRKDLKQALADRAPRLAAFTGACQGFVAHVTGLAKGDAAAIASTGLVTKGRPSRAGQPLLAMPIFKLAQSGARVGEVTLAWTRVKGAQSYVVQLSVTSATGPFTHAASSTRARATLQGMPPRTQVWFQVAAVGAAGQGPFSQPVSATPS
jgi:hypothetical protein